MPFTDTSLIVTSAYDEAVVLNMQQIGLTEGLLLLEAIT